MNNRANFMKRIEPKATRQALDVEKLKQESKTQHHSQHRHVQLRKSDIGGFQFICIFDKKIIVTFHHDLQMFGYFDFHAIHERIRYEYYKWKLASIELKTTRPSPFDEEVVEKAGKAIKEIYGTPRKVLLKVKAQNSIIFKENQVMAFIWGINLERNQSDEIYVTSLSPILRREFSADQVQDILKQSLESEGLRIPKVIDDWIGEFSCKSAYKFNDHLPPPLAKLLISNLERCDFPWYCVHGRNTIHTKSVEQLHSER